MCGNSFAWIGGFVVEGRRQHSVPIGTEERGTEGRRRGSSAVRKGPHPSAGRGASVLRAGGSRFPCSKTQCS